MVATPTWFGPTARPLFGWLHVPDGGRSRGCAVLCPPLGHETANALPALQALGDALAGNGVAALRFSYAGTGDSAGTLDEPNRVGDWLDSIDAAVALARSTGPGPVVLIGLRMGALLAGRAVVGGTPVDGLVQWDPYASGRDFLRIERTLLATGYGARQPKDGSVAGPAFVFSAETVAELSSLTGLPTDYPSTLPTLVVTRKGRRATTTGGRPPGRVDRLEVEGQAELFEMPPDLLTVPGATVDLITAWTLRAMTGPAHRFTFVPVESGEVDRTGGRAVTEHPVWLGPHALFGMVTDPGIPAGPTSPTAVLLSAGALDHTGPGRMWVELARQWAALGIRSVRVDLDGLGETFGRPNQPRQVPKPPEAIDDLVDLAKALDDPDGRNLVVIGLSSGGYHAIEAGLRLHPRAVCAINPALDNLVPEADWGPVDDRRRAFRPMPMALRTLSVRHARMATRIWRAMLQVWVTRSPSDPLTSVSRRGVPVLLIVSEADARQLGPSPYWAVVRWRLARRGLLDQVVVTGDDHSLFTPDGARQAYPVLTEWMRSHFGSPRPPVG